MKRPDDVQSLSSDRERRTRQGLASVDRLTDPISAACVELVPDPRRSASQEGRGAWIPAEVARRVMRGDA